MINLNNVAKNLVMEAVKSVKHEGRPVGQRNLTFSGKLGSNADQLFLKKARLLSNKEKELDTLGQRIANISSKMSNDEVEAAIKDPNSELYKLGQEYDQAEQYVNNLTALMKKYGKEYVDSGATYNDETDAYEGGSVSDTTRKALDTFDQADKFRYNTNLYDTALSHLRDKLVKHGINTGADLSDDLSPRSKDDTEDNSEVNTVVNNIDTIDNVDDYLQQFMNSKQK